MLSPMERLEALSRGYSLEELIEYEQLRGVALIKDLETGVEKIYSHSFAKFLEDRNLAEIIRVADTIQELMRSRHEMARRDAQNRIHKMTVVIERLEKLLKSSRSERRRLLDEARIVKRS